MVWVQVAAAEHMHEAAQRSAAGKHALATAQLRSAVTSHAAIGSKTAGAQRDAGPPAVCGSLRAAQQAPVDLPHLLQRLGAATLQQQLPPAAAVAAARSARSALHAGVWAHSGLAVYWHRRGEAALRCSNPHTGTSLSHHCHRDYRLRVGSVRQFVCGVCTTSCVRSTCSTWGRPSYFFAHIGRWILSQSLATWGVEIASFHHEVECAG